MNTARIHEILEATTNEYRKGEVVTRDDQPGMTVVHVYAMPHESEIPETEERVDVHFMVIGVDRQAAEREKGALLAELRAYPEPERLAGGPSYIELGGVLGSQGAALRLLALGEAVGLWKLITPARFGMTGVEADRAAGAGYVMCTGYDPRNA